MSYISKIKKNEILNFLNDNNLMPVILHDDNGDTIPSIEQSKDGITVRCTKIKQSLAEKHIIKLSNAFTLCGKYSDFSTILILFSDFDVNVINPTDLIDSIDKQEFSLSIFENWINFMNDKFGNQYKLDLINELAKPDYNFEK